MLRISFPVALVAALLVVVAPASAASVTAAIAEETRTEYGETRVVRIATVTVVDRDGLRDEVDVALLEAEVRVTDSAGATAGSGCRQIAGTEVRCAVTADSMRAEVRLGDGDDVAFAHGLFGRIHGDAGQDAINADLADAYGGSGADTLRGRSIVVGGPGPDVLIPDVLVTGRASYAERTAPVTVTPGTGADDGEAGEGDDVRAGFERIVGGSGDDVLTSSSTPAEFGGAEGGPGDDTLVGGPFGDGLSGGEGDDVLLGAGGNDVITGDAGVDRLEGGDGADTLDAAYEPHKAEVQAAPDVLLGGAGNDRLAGTPVAEVLDGGAGTDVLSGRGGPDVLRARDGALDLITCVGTGIALVDAADLVRSCGKVDRAGAGRAQPLLAGMSEPSDAFVVELGCPQDVPRCRVVARLGTARVRLTRRALTVRSGETRFVHLPLLGVGIRRIPRVPAARGRPRFCAYRRATLTLATRDGAGTVRVSRHPVRLGSSGLACALSWVDETRTGWPY